MAEEGQNKTVKEKLLELLARGYKRSQLINDFDFAERTVDEAIKEYRERYGELPAEGAVASKESSKHELMKIGQRDMVAPESIVDALILPADGSTGLVWKDGYLSCLYQVFGIARLLQVLSAGQADIVSSQLQLWREARESNKDIALEAAHSAVGQVMSYIDQKLPKGPPPKDMNEMFAKRLDRMWEMMEHMMEQRMFPGSQGKPPEGWEYEHISQPAPGPQGQVAAQTAKGTPPGWEKEKVKEEKEDVQSGDVRSQSPADGAGEGGGQAPPHGNQEIPPGGQG
jgi:hypothetical protein